MYDYIKNSKKNYIIINFIKYVNELTDGQSLMDMNTLTCHCIKKLISYLDCKNQLTQNENSDKHSKLIHQSNWVK